MNIPNHTGAAVYRITHLPSGRVYVGSTIRTQARVRAHLYELRGGRHGNNALQAAFRESGADAFAVDVLECVDGPRTALRRLEEAWIAALSACDPAHGFNKSPRPGGRREPGARPVHRTSVRLDLQPAAVRLLNRVSRSMGVSPRDVLEMAIRNYARSEGVA